MLSDFVVSALIKQLNFTPTPGQELLIEKLALFITSVSQDELLLINGYAGTGKTTVISAMIKAFDQFGLKTMLLAPTGRAAKVFSSYSEKSAYTIHKKIFRQKSSNDVFGVFQLNVNLHSNTIVIVDEASMISNSAEGASVFGSGQLLNDLIEFTYNNQNCKLIIMGDNAQLPPVNIPMSPALDKGQLECYGKQIIEIKLTDVVRQSLNSGILYNATNLRSMLNAVPNQQLPFPKFVLKQFNDIKRVSGSELIDEINTSYGKYGMEETIVLCRSNKRANLYNQGIRNTILFREEEIAAGDLLMVVRNNYFWLNDYKDMDFIANGDIVEVSRIHKYEERYGYRFANITCRFIDHDNMEADVKIMINTLTLETANLNTESNKKLFFDIAEDYSDIKSKKERYKKVKNNPFFNALQVKFAYAITCHKAQGGQWKSVFIDQGYFKEDMLNTDYIRWLYTAFTRSTEQLMLVNFKNDFFENN